MPSSPYRPGYVDWEVSWWLTSEIRLTKPKALQMTYCELCWKLWIDGGRTTHNPEFLARLTLDTPENVTEILKWRHFQIHKDGTFSHRVVTEKLAAQQARRDKGTKGGRPVQRQMADLPDNVDNLPQNGITSGLTSGVTIDRTKDRSIDRSYASPKPANVDNSSGPPPKTAGQVKPGVASDPKIKSQEPTPERLAQLVETCRAVSNLAADRSRPWLTAQSGSWYSRQPVHVQVAFERAFIERYGFGLDAGPPES